MISLNRIVAAVLALFVFQASAATKQDPQSQKIVDEVRDMADKARKERSADPWLLKAMDDLVKRYDQPWRHTVVDETFSDGNYNKNPVWTVSSGKFWVDRSLGLRSRATPAPAEKQKEEKKSFEDALREAMIEEMGGRSKQDKPASSTAAAEIYLRGKITNSFSLDVRFTQHQPPADPGHIEFGLFDSTGGGRGYVLTVTTGAENAIELLRVKGNTAAIVERKLLPKPIDTGDPQNISWRRDKQGGMTVLLNDKPFIETGDRGLTGNFSGFSIMNRAGDFAVKKVKLLDAG